MVTLNLTSEQSLQLTIDRFWETFPPVWDRIRGNIHLIVANHFDISVEQFQILRLIRKGAGSVSELATARQISRSGMSQAIDILVDKGLITRTESAEDRRYTRLELTSQGDDLLDAIFKKNRSWMMEKLAQLGPEEISGILCGMEALKKTFDPAAK